MTEAGVMRNMEIVELKNGEAPLCKDLRLRALKDAPNAFSETYEQAIEFDNSYWDLISKSLVKPNQQRMFIARDSDINLGTVYALIDQNDVSIGRLGGMWVDSQNRNSGIGKKLFDSHRNWANILNLKCIQLWVEDSETSAKPFYAKLGFIETGVNKPHSYKMLCEMQYNL